MKKHYRGKLNYRYLFKADDKSIDNNRFNSTNSSNLNELKIDAKRYTLDSL